MSVDNPEQQMEPPVDEFLVNKFMVAIGFKWQDDTQLWANDANVWMYQKAAIEYYKVIDAHYKAQASKDMADVIGEDESETWYNKDLITVDQKLVETSIRRRNHLRKRQRKTAASKGYGIGG